MVQQGVDVGDAGPVPAGNAGQNLGEAAGMMRPTVESVVPQELLVRPLQPADGASLTTHTHHSVVKHVLAEHPPAGRAQRAPGRGHAVCTPHKQEKERHIHWEGGVSYPKLDARPQIFSSLRLRSGSSSSCVWGSGLGVSWGPTYKTSTVEFGKST